MSKLSAWLGVPAALAVAIIAAVMHGERPPLVSREVSGNAATESTTSPLSSPTTDGELSTGPVNTVNGTGEDGAPKAPEGELMARARGALEQAPAQALHWLEQADQRFGRVDEERRVLEIEALVRQQRIGLAHARAAQFYRRFPKSAERASVERLTGYHPRPWGPGER